MKKREFLAMGGAVPLMLAGCGDKGGSANVRLINASAAYPLLGFEIGTTQATSTDVAYGNASPFESVDSGTQTTTLTTTTTTGGTSTVTGVLSTTRLLNKGTRYSLVAYGSSNLASVLITENQSDPASGQAAFNVLNTSAVSLDIFVTATTDISGLSPLITQAFGQSSFHPETKGTYVITVTAAGQKSDVRLVIPSVVLADQQVLTLVLTPANSGALMNGILVTQASGGSVVSEVNTRARVRAIVSLGTGLTTTVSPVTVTATSPVIVTDSNSQNWTSYKLVDISTQLTVTVSDSGGTTRTVPVLPSLTALTAGNDYTVLVYGRTVAEAVATLLVDDNSLPTTTGVIRIAMLNGVVTTDGSAFPLSLAFNSQSIVSQLPKDSISGFTNAAVSTAQTTTSELIVSTGSVTVATKSPVQVTIGSTYLAVVSGIYDPSATNPVAGLQVTFQTTGTTIA